MQLQNALLFLTLLQQNVLYVSKLANTRDAFICVANSSTTSGIIDSLSTPTSSTTSYCDVWPQNWKRMELTTINNGDLGVMKIELTESQVSEDFNFKLKIFTNENRYHDTAEWNSVKICENTDDNNSVLIKNNNTTTNNNKNLDDGKTSSILREMETQHNAIKTFITTVFSPQHVHYLTVIYINLIIHIGTFTLLLYYVLTN